MRNAGRRDHLVVEDLADTRAWLTGACRSAFGSEPIGVATLAEARAWLARRDRTTPLLALVDLGLPDGSGIELIAEIAAGDPDATIVVTTIFEDDDNLFRAFGAGATGYLLKDVDRAGLERRLAGIAEGEVPISPAIARRLIARYRDVTPAGPALSPRETEVLGVIGRGLTAREAAQALAVGEHTIASHVKAIYRKLEISSRAEAALEARRRGLA